MNLKEVIKRSGRKCGKRYTIKKRRGMMRGKKYEGEGNEGGELGRVNEGKLKEKQRVEWRGREVM